MAWYYWVLLILCFFGALYGAIKASKEKQVDEDAAYDNFYKDHNLYQYDKTSQTSVPTTEEFNNAGKIINAINPE